jgi:hypothetical protein
MAGLNLRVGGFGGIQSGPAPSYGTSQSYDSVTQQAFGPGATVPSASLGDALNPTEPVGAAVVAGVVAVALLVLIRRSLPR